MSTVTIDPLAEEEQRGGGRARILLVIGGGLLVALLAAGSAWWWFGDAAEAAEDEPLVEGEIVEFEPQTTTLGGSTDHARVAMAVVLAERVDPEVIPPKAPLLRDALLRELAELDGATLRSAEGSARLRDELTDAARRIWDDDQVVRVVLTELVVN